MSIPKDLVYAPTHEWARIAPDKTAYIGITDHAQSEMGDIVFVNLPAVGDKFAAGEVFGDVESVKAVSDLYCPVTGTVAAINEELLDNPALINESAYDAWLIKLEDVEYQGGLLNAEEYEEHLKKEG